MSENLLLAALPKAERERLDPFLEVVQLKAHQELIAPNEPITNMYFPYDAVTSTVQEMSDGSIIETGLMGVEGLVGIQLWLRSRTTPSRTLVQVPGRAHRMSADDFIREVMERPSPLNELSARYAHAFLVMTSQVAACNRLHSLDERMCRWLSLVQNRVQRTEFPLRQDFMAQMLGVHRGTVSITASILQKAGFISYSRGQMKILDPDGLREGSCECLGIMERQFDQIFDRSWQEFAKQEAEE